MITAYHRPETLVDAINLLARPNARPLGGGTILSRPAQESFEVVDLQSLGLNQIKVQGESLVVGATATLQTLHDHTHTPPALKKALKLEAPLNLRNAATVAGALVTADGRSSFTTVLLALDARLTIEGGKSKTKEKIALGEFLPQRPEKLQGRLITGIGFPLNTGLALETVARTPADAPIVSAALASWPSGRTRLALGGFGPLPLLAMDGTEADGLESAARNAFHEAGDEWASAEYRMQVAGTLAKRCLAAISGRDEDGQL